MGALRRLLRVLGVVLVAALVLGGSAPQRTYTYDGTSSNDRLGHAACAGDVNADGYYDFIGGAPGYANDTGHVRVWSGEDGSQLYEYTGDAQGDLFGAWVSRAGDVDKDGCDDFVVGARFNSSGGTNAGMARVYSGKDGSTIHTFLGSANDVFGADVSGAGDVDADGYADIIVGTNATATGAGCYARVYSGKTGKVLFTFTPVTRQASIRGAAAGDVDHDGHDDLAVAAEQSSVAAAEAFVYSGADGSQIYQWTVGISGTGSGSQIDGAGDVNGDGYDDVAVTGLDKVGGKDLVVAKVFSGKDGSTLHTIHATGTSVTRPRLSIGGDVDGDGCADIAVGLVLSSSDKGRVTVYSGADASELFTLYGDGSGDSFGFSMDLSPAGDLVVGAPNDDDGAMDAGRVFVYLSPAPSGSITIGSGAVATASPYVTLTLSWRDGHAAVKDMRLRDKGESWGDFEELASTRSWTLPAGEGPHTVQAQFRDEDGLLSPVFTDSIILDQTIPVGAISIEDGADWVNDTKVDVKFAFTDVPSGVAHVRLRNEGGAWCAWCPATDLLSWTLVPGPVEKVVEAQAADYAGNLSAVVADMVRVDQTPPTGTITIDDGGQYATSTLVTLKIAASDSGGSGLAGMRLKHIEAREWGGWLPVTEKLAWSIPSRDGEQGIMGEFRDHAGNNSATAYAVVLLDRTAPTLDFLRVNRDRPYVLPEEPVEYAVYAHDNMQGSGLDAFRYTVDGGTTFSGWISLLYSNIVEGVRPAQSGLLSIRAALRDRAGNESALSDPVEAHFVEAKPRWLGSSGAFIGALSDSKDIDVVAFDLVKGDLLAIRVKATATPDKKAAFPLVMDLTRPTGERVIEKIGPAGLESFTATATGRYILVLREEGEGSAAGTYALSVAVKPSPAAAKWKGTAAGGEIVFEAVEGSALRASFKGPGLDPATIAVEGQEGPVATTVAGKPGSAKITAMLDRGTGEYRIRCAAEGPVLGSWSLARPKRTKLAE